MTATGGSSQIQMTVVPRMMADAENNGALMCATNLHHHAWTFTFATNSEQTAGAECHRPLEFRDDS